MRQNPGKGLPDGCKPVFDFMNHRHGDMFIGAQRGGCMGVLGSNGSRRKHRGRSSRAILPFITAFGAGDTVAYPIGLTKLKAKRGFTSLRFQQKPESVNGPYDENMRIQEGISCTALAVVNCNCNSARLLCCLQE